MPLGTNSRSQDKPTDSNDTDCVSVPCPSLVVLLDIPHHYYLVCDNRSSDLLTNHIILIFIHEHSSMPVDPCMRVQRVMLRIVFGNLWSQRLVCLVRYITPLLLSLFAVQWNCEYLCGAQEQDLVSFPVAATNHQLCKCHLPLSHIALSLVLWRTRTTEGCDRHGRVTVDGS